MNIEDLQLDAQDRTTTRKSKINGLNALKKTNPKNQNNSFKTDNNTESEIEKTTYVSPDAVEKIINTTDNITNKEKNKSDNKIKEADKSIHNDNSLNNIDAGININGEKVIIQKVGVITDGMQYKTGNRERRTKRIGFVVEPSRFEAFKKFCDENDYSMSDIISAFMDSFNKANGCYDTKDN